MTRRPIWPDRTACASASSRSTGTRPSAWPEAAHRLHIDFSVEDLDKAEAELVDPGAVKPEYQPGEGKWTVLLDPAGYPFCITTMAG
ncbi:hypothetical protein GCM10020254_76140 [Streptomyces goshikiensis]